MRNEIEKKKKSNRALYLVGERKEKKRNDHC